METMIRKEWGSPKGNVQVFTPQEYAAQCSIVIPGISASSQWLRVDWDGDWHADKWEEFSATNQGSPDGGQSHDLASTLTKWRLVEGINVYYLVTPHTNTLSAEQEIEHWDYVNGGHSNSLGRDYRYTNDYLLIQNLYNNNRGYYIMTKENYYNPENHKNQS